MDNDISQVKKQINEDHAVIVIDNSDITKPCSPRMEAISDVRGGTGMSYIMGKHRTLWMWQINIKGITEWILWIRMGRKQSAKSVISQ